MKQLRCILVDDEPLPLELLAAYAEKCPLLQLVGAFNNPLEALAVIGQQNIDLVFLDIQMPEITGVQFIQLIPEKCKVIFTTAYSNFALQGYELEVVDYLLKPITFERFLKAVKKAEALFISVPIQQEIIAPINTEQALFVKSDHRIVKIFPSQILFIEGLKEYIAIHTTECKIITLQNLKKMEEVLPEKQFFRVHKSFIVAVSKIDFIERSRVFIGEKIIPIGDTYRETFLAHINYKELP